MPVRWAWWLEAADNNDVGDFRGVGNDYLWNAGIGEEGFDSDMICTTAKPAKPINLDALSGGVGIIGFDGPRPDCNTAKIHYENDHKYTAVRTALEAGLRIGFMHAYSDGSFDALFHMLEQAMAEGKLTEEELRALRITTEHTPIIRPDSIAKIAQYGIRPSFTAYMMQGNLKGGAFLKTYGEQYMPWMMPLRSLVDAGVHPGFGSDAHLGKGIPVEWQDMDFPAEWAGSVWAFYQFFVTRQMPNEGITYDPKEGGDRVAVMKAATIWGAEQLLNEKNIGSLEVGKLADFIVIDKDFFTIPEKEISTIKTLLTVVGGKTVYKASNY